MAERLESIYLFCKRTLIEAQLALDPEPIERVGGLPAELRGTWAEAAENARPVPAGAEG